MTAQQTQQAVEKFFTATDLREVEQAYKDLATSPDNSIFNLLSRYLSDVEDKETREKIVEALLARTVQISTSTIVDALPAEKKQSLKELLDSNPGNLTVAMTLVVICDSILKQDYGEILRASLVQAIQEFDEMIDTAGQTHDKVNSMTPEQIDTVFADLEKGNLSSLLELTK